MTNRRRLVKKKTFIAPKLASENAFKKTVHEKKIFKNDVKWPKIYKYGVWHYYMVKR